LTVLMQRMREELVRRTYSETTIRSYLHAVEAFRQHVQKRLDHLGPDDLRRYQVYLLEDRKLTNGVAFTVSSQIVGTPEPDSGITIVYRSEMFDGCASLLVEVCSAAMPLFRPLPALQV